MAIYIYATELQQLLDKSTLEKRTAKRYVLLANLCFLCFDPAGLWQVPTFNMADITAQLWSIPLKEYKECFDGKATRHLR